MECDFRPLLAAADPGREQLLQQLEVAAISHPAAVSPVSTGGGVEQFFTPVCGQLPGICSRLGRQMIMRSCCDGYDDHVDVISDQQLSYVSNRGGLRWQVRWDSCSCLLLLVVLTISTYVIRFENLTY
jgi:hypothetical protein